MMMQSMMHHPQMMGGGMGMGMGYPQYGGYRYHAQPVVSPSATAPSSASTSSGFGSRIKDYQNKRGSIYDNMWEMSLMNNWLNPQNTGAAAPGATQGQKQNNGFSMQDLAALEMALGDAQ